MTETQRSIRPRSTYNPFRLEASESSHVGGDTRLVSNPFVDSKVAAVVEGPVQLKEQPSSHRQARNVDAIDKMDITCLFGGTFHHGGPFDAVTPHRNRNNRIAPMMAFPVNGANSSIARKADDDDDDEEEDRIYGLDPTTVSGIRRYHTTTNVSKRTIDSSTLGLGSTTFLDGAPASQRAIQQAKSNGLHRKKSLSQRLHLSSTATISPRTSLTELQRASTTTTGKKESTFLRRVKSLRVGR